MCVFVIGLCAKNQSSFRLFHVTHDTALTHKPDVLGLNNWSNIIKVTILPRAKSKLQELQFNHIIIINAVFLHQK